MRREEKKNFFTNRSLDTVLPVKLHETRDANTVETQIRVSISELPN